MNKGNANSWKSWFVKSKLVLLICTFNTRNRSTDFFFFNRRTQTIINFNQRKKKIYVWGTFPSILFYDMASIICFIFVVVVVLS